MRGTLLIFLFTWLLVACTSANEPSQKVIDLTALQPIPTPSSNAAAPLRVAVAAVISPQGTVESYASLLTYIESRLGRPIELVTGANYAEVNDLLRAGEVDLAFICTGAYIAGARDFEMQLLVAPEVKGKTVYHSLLIVPFDSSATTLEDLRGKTFAFTDPLSLSGRLYPIYTLKKMGYDAETFFEQTFFTYSHEASIRAVANKLADGAAVDSLVYEFMIEREPDIARKTRVIYVSPPFGIPPVVVGPNIRPQLRAELEEIFLHMHEDATGRVALNAIGVDRFLLLNDDAYETARQIYLSSGLTSYPEEP
ncbi:MAG: phosphate/phosphite/phosphonate ABC transporter substrate-binding protein [Anaerolineales bacterium]